MNNDGWGFMGAGADDKRLAGKDLQHNLQHNLQTRTADEGTSPARIVTQPRESGGPMKEHMDHEMRHHMNEHLEEEKHRHHEAMEHHKHHLEKHHMRNFDSQHGHDTFNY